MPKYPRETGKPIDLPVYGDAQHNMGIYHAIGVLVINSLLNNPQSPRTTTTYDLSARAGLAVERHGEVCPSFHKNLKKLARDAADSPPRLVPP